MPRGYLRPRVGALNMENRVLHWIVVHIIRPKNDSFSRVDNPEIGLLYLLNTRPRLIGLIFH
jgi:hypothetical protein